MLFKQNKKPHNSGFFNKKKNYCEFVLFLKILKKIFAKQLLFVWHFAKLKPNRNCSYG